jgi:hypothetical protein
LAEKIRAGEVSSKNQFGSKFWFLQEKLLVRAKEFCLLMPVGRFFLKRKTRADARSVLVSKKLSLGGHRIREGTSRFRGADYLSFASFSKRRFFMG